MDSKMKGMVMAGMVVLSLVLGLLAVLGSSWITAEEEGMEANYSLSEAEVDTGIFGTMVIDYGDSCDESDDDNDEICDLALAGTIGTIGLWLGIVMAVVFAAMLVLPMAGVDAMDGMPGAAKQIISWGTGLMMLLGTVGWLILKPELEDGMELGMSFFMAIIAGVLGLAASAMGMLVKADE